MSIIIAGKNTVKEAIKVNRKIYELYVLEGTNKDLVDFANKNPDMFDNSEIYKYLSEEVKYLLESSPNKQIIENEVMAWKPLTFNNLDTASYTVIMVDQNNCSDTMIAVLDGVDSLQITNLTSVTTTCGLDNGSIDFDVAFCRQMRNLQLIAYLIDIVLSKKIFIEEIERIGKNIV